MFNDSEVAELVSVTHPRPKAPGVVESITWAFPDAEATLINGELICSLMLTPEDVEALRLSYYKYTLVAYYMEVGNNLQVRALAYHTVTDKTSRIQQDVYTIKYQQAVEFLKDTTSPVPPIIETESSMVGEDPLVLANKIVSNYEASMSSLSSYFGALEGTRRLLKRRILEATSFQELDELPRVYLPLYEPTVPVDYDE